jgi:hypothetical protein
VDVRAFEGLGELETVLSSERLSGEGVSGDGPLQTHDGRAHLPGLGFVWLAEA